MNVFLTALLFTNFPGLLAAPNLTLPSNVTLAENVPQNTLVASISAEAAEFDTIVGAPFIVNSNPVVHPFLIIPKGPNYWELITTNNPKLDYEAVSLFSLQVLVEDSKGTSATQTIVIEISNVNKAPVFTGILAKRDAEMYISENTIVSTVIYKVAAKDPDNDVLQIPTSPNCELKQQRLLSECSGEQPNPYQYSIRIAPVNAGFEIDNTGSISTTTTFDYESNTKSYTITVTISDGVLSNTANIKVYITNVNDNVPLLTCIFISITDSGVNTKTETSGNRAVIELNEELPIGTIITTCTATDEDQMNDLFFLLDPGSSYFTIHRETGTVIILSRMDIEEVGFVNVHSYTIKVCDSGFKCSSIPATVTILPVNDNPPHCDQYLYSFTEPEPIAADTVVATLKCHDPDIPPNPLVYKANSGPVGAGELFSQRVDNPHIIQVNKALDYDTDPVTSYELMISVSDSPDTPHTVTTTVIVSVKPVNDFSPVFDPPAYTFTVRETAKADFTVGEVTATDADRPNCVKYGIQKGNMDVISRFWINPTSGVIKLITNPDFETVPSYTLTVEATDCDEKNPRKAQASVTIHIIEENDEPPICRPETYTAVMYDNVTSGININNFRLSCNDKDSNDTSMRFVIASGNLNNHFAFDPTHGSHNPKLIVKNPFDFENGADTEQKYNLVVHIIDDNVKDGRVENPKTGTVLISISVVRTNTPAPPTTDYYKRKGLTIVNKQVNTYDSSAWYVPFVFTLTAVFFVGLLGWACHLIWKYTNLKAFCQKAKTKIQMKKVRTYNAGTKKEKVEVITETTTYETVFDGEAVDPVTGNIYEYNTKSGARRWKVSSGKDENIKLSDISTVSETLTPVLPPSPLIPKND